MATITGDTETDSYIQLLLDAKDAVKNAPAKLISYAQWLIVAFKLTLKTSFYLAFGTPRLGIMSYLTGNNKLLNTFRGVSRASLNPIASRSNQVMTSRQTPTQLAIRLGIKTLDTDITLTRTTRSILGSMLTTKKI